MVELFFHDSSKNGVGDFLVGAGALNIRDVAVEYWGVGHLMSSHWL
jgi:hypothetical protein